MSILSVHLGSKGQPWIANDGREESPRITGSFVLRLFPGLSETAGMDWNKALVYGWWGDASTVSAGPQSTTPPASRTSTRAAKTTSKAAQCWAKRKRGTT